jgi:hypothetical protein
MFRSDLAFTSHASVCALSSTTTAAELPAFVYLKHAGKQRF